MLCQRLPISRGILGILIAIFRLNQLPESCSIPEVPSMLPAWVRCRTAVRFICFQEACCSLGRHVPTGCDRWYLWSRWQFRGLIWRTRWWWDWRWSRSSQARWADWWGWGLAAFKLIQQVRQETGCNGPREWRGWKQGPNWWWCWRRSPRGAWCTADALIDSKAPADPKEPFCTEQARSPRQGDDANFLPSTLTEAMSLRGDMMNRLFRLSVRLRCGAGGADPGFLKNPRNCRRQSKHLNWHQCHGALGLVLYGFWMGLDGFGSPLFFSCHFLHRMGGVGVPIGHHSVESRGWKWGRACNLWVFTWFYMVFTWFYHVLPGFIIFVLKAWSFMGTKTNHFVIKKPGFDHFLTKLSIYLWIKAGDRHYHFVEPWVIDRPFCRMGTPLPPSEWEGGWFWTLLYGLGISMHFYAFLCISMHFLFWFHLMWASSFQQISI